MEPAILNTARLNNFRLNHLSPALQAQRDVYIRILLGGSDIQHPNSPTRVLLSSVTIRDLLNDDPNTATLKFYGAAPTVGQSLKILLNSNNPVILFTGELQVVDRSYMLQNDQVVHPARAIDDTARANRRRPLEIFTNVSASTVATQLLAKYAPGFSAAGVEPDLPAVTVNFDGSEAGLKGCLTQIAKLIGGYWYFEDLTLYLFINPPPGPTPDPIDDTPKRFSDKPHINWTIDKSQVRTRVFGKGASTRLAGDVAAGAVSIPLDTAVMFNAAGGKAIAGTTPDGAASQVLTYTSLQLGGGGALVGPGAAPGAPPPLSITNGSGVTPGTHQYAVTFVTATGETIPSPVAAINVTGVTPAPPTAPTPGAPTAGGAVTGGTYEYRVTFVTALGETNYGPPSAQVTIPAAVSAPPTPAAFSLNQSGYTSALDVDRYYYWVTTFYNPTTGLETLPSPSIGLHNGTSIVGLSWTPSTPIGYTAPAGYVIRWYRTHGYSSHTTTPGPFYLVTGGFMSGGRYHDFSADTSLSTTQPPSTNTTASVGTIPLTAIPIGGVNVTSRRLYRYAYTGATWYLAATIANNTQTTYNDAAANSSLPVAAPPATNTATAAQVAIGVQTGPSAVTQRKIYRTAANVTGILQLLATVADNTTTTYTDAIGDASLGAAPPTGDTSGLKQPEGQILPGATTVIVANTSPFAAIGGWAVIGNGEQVIAYTGKTNTSLTGVPATGPGAVTAAVSYNSTITAAAGLFGVTGVTLPFLRGSPIHVWVQRDDVPAQAAMVTLDGGGDGVYEHIVSDERRSEASLVQVCDAQLQQFARPLITVTYDTRDQKTKSGKTVTIDIATPHILETLTIQEVTITELGIIPGLSPRFSVRASSIRQSLDAILRMLLRKADA